MSRLFNVLFTQTRSYKGQRPPKAWKGEGVKYGLVTYYPRHPGEKDPPIVPTKLLMVNRVKPYKGNPWWHKEILDQLRLTDYPADIAIVKNTPENCAMLWKIKHLIRVTAINMPDNLPDPEGCTTFLHENGDLLITPPVDPERVKATNRFIHDKKRLDKETLFRELRKRWQKGYNL